MSKEATESLISYQSLLMLKRGMTFKRTELSVIALVIIVFFIAIIILLPSIRTNSLSYGQNNPQSIPYTPAPSRSALQMETFQLPTPTPQIFKPKSAGSLPKTISSGKVTKIACSDTGGNENWSGYLFSLQSVTKQTVVSGSWSVSSLTCNDNSNNTEGISQWVGVDGSQPTGWIAQVGSYDICQSGTAIYSAWTEAYPQPFVPSIGSQYVVKPGDTITAKVTMTGFGTFQTTMSDSTQGWSYQTPLSFGSNYQPVNEGEMILEDEGFGSNSPLPEFSVSSFTGNSFSINNSTLSSIADAPKLRCVNIAQNGTVKDNTSPLTGPNFTISWIHK